MGAGFDGVDGTDQIDRLETEIVMISAWNVVAPLIHQSITTSKPHPLAARSVDPAPIRVMASPSAISHRISWVLLRPNAAQRWSMRQECNHMRTTRRGVSLPGWLGLGREAK